MSHGGQRHADELDSLVHSTINPTPTPACLQMPTVESPPGHEAEATQLLHLPRLPAVTAANLTSVDEALASFTIPHASALIGAVMPAVDIQRCFNAH